ncbi:hypothetical protein [Streptomyces sp. e14]|uniref:hypothetical protein n=1 Tax=Streptomyces sp. e14 TaxID=645465 RepID=UPI0012E221C6|nr:hypothetical protein [Streptomyces sp. e14]
MPEDDEQRTFIAIVCTDKGQHRRLRLTTARLLPSERGMSFALEHFAPPMRNAAPSSMVSRESYTFICPKCRRSPLIKAEAWWRLLEAWAEAGHDEFDISLLP